MNGREAMMIMMPFAVVVCILLLYLSGFLFLHPKLVKIKVSETAYIITLEEQMFFRYTGSWTETISELDNMVILIERNEDGKKIGHTLIIRYKNGKRMTVYSDDKETNP